MSEISSPDGWKAVGGPMNGNIIAKSGTVDESKIWKHGGVHFTDEEKDQLIMCPTSDSFIPSKLKEHLLGPAYKGKYKPALDKDPNSDFNWKKKQREIAPKHILDGILGHLGDSPVTGSVTGSGSVNVKGYQDRFHECVAAKVGEELTEREFMKELLFLGPRIDECIETFDEDKCEQGFSDAFISLPAALREKTGSMSAVTLDPLSFKDQEIVLDEMIHRSADTERTRCNETVSDTTKALRKKRRNYDVDFQGPDMSFLWVIRDEDGLRTSLSKIMNFLVIIVAIYVIGNLLIQLLSRGSESK